MNAKRFLVAFSFAGEQREFVEQVAAIFAQRFGKNRILYDKYYEAEFATADLGLDLPDLYHKESNLVVVVICKDYSKKEWTGLEWRDPRAHQRTKSEGCDALPLRPGGDQGPV